MNEKKLFDLLENAENDSMNRLIDKCPEISDKQLDRILAKSEKKFRKLEKEYDKRGNNIKVTENDVVEGVERSRRPVWLSYLSTAASLLLVAGAIIGGTAVLSRHGGHTEPDGNITPAATAEATAVSGTETVSTGSRAAGTAGTETAAVSTDTSTQPVTEDTTGETTGITDIVDIAGQWTLQESDGNYTVDHGARNVALVSIGSDGTYTYTDVDGNTSRGTTEIVIEEIGGTELTGVRFSEGGSLRFSATCLEERPDEMHVGNGGMARLVRGSLPLTKEEKPTSRADMSDISDIAGTWTYQESDGNYTVDLGAKNVATVVVNSDGTYTYTEADGTVYYGRVDKTAEELNGVDMPYFRFYEGSYLRFSVLYVQERPNEMYTGNGGMARLIRGSYALDRNDGEEEPLDIRTLAGQWTYQEANGNNSVVVDPVNVGTLTVNADGTYSYTDMNGSTSTGTVKTGYEEIGGTKLPTVNFYKNGSFYLGGYYDDAHPDEIYLGNGGMARIIR